MPKTTTINDLFSAIEVGNIPKMHKGKFNENYETVLSAFVSSNSKAIAVNCANMGKELKALSVAHTFRAKIKEKSLRVKVQLNAQKEIVYLIKREK